MVSALDTVEHVLLQVEKNKGCVCRFCSVVSQALTIWMDRVDEWDEKSDECWKEYT